MTERLIRLVNSNADLSFINCSYINYACKDTAFAVRLLRDSAAKSAKYTEDSLYSAEALLNTNFIQLIPTETVAYKGKVLDIVAECVFDTQTFFKHALRPLSNYLIYTDATSIRVVNYQLETAVSHFRVPEYIKSINGRAICLAQIYTVNADDVLEKCSKSLLAFKDIEIITNIDTSAAVSETRENVASDQYSGRRKLQATLKLEAMSESVEADGEIQMKVSCVLDGELETSANFAVNIEPVDGYVPHKRVTLQSGEATFTAYAFHLAAGDSMRIKVGLPFYSGLAECTVPVVASTKQEEISYQKSDELLIAELNAASKSMDSVKESLYAYIDASIRNRFEAYKESVANNEQKD